MVKFSFSKRLLFLVALIIGISVLSTFILSATYLTYTLVTPVNASNQSISSFAVNMTISGTTWSGLVNTCTYVVGMSNGTRSVNQTMSNESSTWYNTTKFTVPDTGYGWTNNSNQWNNLTFFCNYTEGGLGPGTPNETSGTKYFFKMDTTAPTMNFTTASYTVNNDSTWSFFFWVKENNYDNCYLRYYQENITTPANKSVPATYILGTWGAKTLGLNSQSNCTVTFNASSYPAKTTNGQFVIEGWANDSVGRSAGTSPANITAIATKIYANKWNMIEYSGANRSIAVGRNETVSNFIREHFSYATIISIWNNNHGNYTTYSASTPSINNDTLLREGTPVYIYSSAEKWYIQPNYLPVGILNQENATLVINYTQKNTTRWNQIGLFWNTSMNTVLYACSYNGTAASGPVRPGSCANEDYNVTYASWWNVSGSSYVTCKKGFSICSGGANPINVNLPIGSAVWMLPTSDSVLNITLNRTNIY